ncbi:fluoride efflux transporter CrcB [Prosthecobacter vanneervenii]|uniref:Fluoride-specific ion channel FluC n=1 Tax=Prosthecobacter vanneervenii TaxID=48466 RepID=A0A7W7YBM7_9BACT|nr:fluoride efflux transporter CrcB [Prosthecobacter vanneervenii]MBB5033233.1 CrcB protein [Prosthecobacter vanneervenii]
MKNVVLIFLGGGFGSVLRYYTVIGMARLLPKAAFPWGVLTANLCGSFILGFLFALPAMKDKGSGPWLFAATGVLGGYTTFSTLANDSWLLLLNQHSWLALFNAIGSILLGITAAACGWWAGSRLA